MTYEEFLVDDLGEESCIHPTDLEAFVDEEVTKAFIPSPRCLLEPIERLVQPIDMIRISRVLKPERLFNINQLINEAI